MAQITWHNEIRRIKDLIPYVAVAIQRWVDVTGGVPELLADIQADTGDGS